MVFRDYRKPRFPLTGSGLVRENVPARMPEDDDQLRRLRLWKFVGIYRDSFEGECVRPGEALRQNYQSGDFSRCFL